MQLYREPVYSQLSMEYALQLLIPILLGLFLGIWLNSQFGLSMIWAILFAIVGMFAGIGILYKRSLMSSKYTKPEDFKQRRTVEDEEDED